MPTTVISEVTVWTAKREWFDRQVHARGESDGGMNYDELKIALYSLQEKH